MDIDGHPPITFDQNIFFSFTIFWVGGLLQTDIDSHKPIAQG